MSDLVTMPVDTPVRAVMGLFHGGGFVNGKPDKLRKLADALTKLGIGSISFAYRTYSKDGAMVRDAIDDARSAAHKLKSKQMDVPILFGGTSAGGVLAVHAGLEVPAAGVVLLNPVLDLTETGFRKEKVMTGGEEALSPLHIPLDTFPPTLILHGAADKLTPIEDSALFVQRLRTLGTTAELVRYEDVGHGLLKWIPADRLAARIDVFIREIS